MRRLPTRGAALLLAMVVLTLVATLAAGMVWQQQRSVHVEAAERARVQAALMLDAGIDAARFTIRNLSSEKLTSIAPWDLELQETRLSALLTADRDNSGDADLDAYFQGHVEDALARYNLRNLLGEDGKPVAGEVDTVKRLCELAGLGSFADTLIAAVAASGDPAAGQARTDPSRPPVAIISRMEHLRQLGLDADGLARLQQVMDLLPERGTRLNLNTAPAGVIAAVSGLPGGQAAQLARVGGPRKLRHLSVSDANAAAGLTGVAALAEARFSTTSNWFYIHANVRFEDRALASRALVKYEGQGNAPIPIRQLERRPLSVAGSNTAATGSR